MCTPFCLEIAECSVAPFAMEDSDHSFSDDQNCFPHCSGDCDDGQVPVSPSPKVSNPSDTSTRQLLSFPWSSCFSVLLLIFTKKTFLHLTHHKRGTWGTAWNCSWILNSVGSFWGSLHYLFLFSNYIEASVCLAKKSYCGEIGLCKVAECIFYLLLYLFHCNWWSGYWKSSCQQSVTHR